MPTFYFAQHSLEFILVTAAVLLILSVLASKISSLFGVPALLIFLGIGMAAGSEGPGGIQFSNYSLSFAVGSVCLAFIIFDGGMRTSWNRVRPTLGMGISLSSVGVSVTALATGAFAHFVLQRPWAEAILLGCIVSSTDAAAVFSVLRAKSLALTGRLKQTLEFEAGSNDPTAVLLTVVALNFATLGPAGASGGSIASTLELLLMQVGLGLMIGWLSGRGIRWLINRIGIEHEGLYSVLLFGFVVLVFGATSALGGSGFLAVYVTGLVLGNAEMLHKGSMLRFHDGIAWIAQIIVFLVLGLLAFPSRVLPLWREGLLLALFMMFVARPLSVLIAAPSKRLKRNERLFISWVGLRGAAPIILATLPWSVGVPNAESIFDLVFFVVVVSVIAQGMTIPWVARKLDVISPLEEEPFHESPVGVLPVGFIAIEVEVQPNSEASQRRIVDLALPSGVLFTSLERGDRYLIPRGATQFDIGDRLTGLARPSNLEALKDLFGSARIIT